MSDPLRDVDVEATREPDAQVMYWQKEIDLSKKREKRFRREAEKALKLYEAEKSESNDFNILYANTETLLPAIYNQLPRPIVDRRFHDADPTGKAASKCLERTLVYLTDSPDQKYEGFDRLMQQAVLGALVPGRGVSWFRYEADIQTPPPDEMKEDTEEEAATVTGDLLPPEGQVKYETVCGEDVDYDSFLVGYARQWTGVPWVAREHSMTKDDATDNFGKEVADQMKFSPDNQKDGESKQDEAMDEERNKGSTKTAHVYEIWDKTDHKVKFFAPSLKSMLCKVVDDPYGLSGFFPCPMPLQFLIKRSTMVPSPLYKVYEEQARQLNRITMRIARITNALKVRGFFDGTIQGLKELMNSDDNTMIAAKNVASMQQGQNLQNSVWFMPLEMLIKTLNQLYEAQENAKNTIYEITGIADIMRGDTQASETATAQNIKNKWGTLRLQKMQGAAQDYVRDCLRIMSELASEHFGMETFASMTNLDYATPQELQQAQAMQQSVMQLMAQAQQMTPPPAPAMSPTPGAPPAAAPPAPPPSPELQQIMGQIQQLNGQIAATNAKPKWDEVLGLLKNDMLRQYRIDIETNSTLANTSAEDQQNITSAMTAISNTMASFLPAVEQGVFPMPAFKSILVSMVRRFEFGREVEDQINAIPDQVPQTPNNTPAKAPAGPDPAETAAKVQAAQAQAATAQLANQTAQAELNFKNTVELPARQLEIQQKQELAASNHQLKLATNAQKLAELQSASQITGMETQAAAADANADIFGAQAGVAVDKANVRAANAKAKLAAQKPAGEK